ncbi:hypothetical protein V1517DRAFT_329640 [Lipomyces orientalis]|uniref:Uncharacterized protein n=1 Tax=Lipomyces orientalis TaxID=1233043 RepID=A0ACC3THI0_9ASCO
MPQHKSASSCISSTMPSTTAPADFVGGDSWIQSEISNMKTIVESTLEDFAYAAKDELAWLGDRVDFILKDSTRKAGTAENMMFPRQIEHAKLAGSPLKQIISTPMAPGSDKGADKENVNPRTNSSKREQASSVSLPPFPPAPTSSTAESSSPTARRQATLPAVAEFNSDPILLPSSSSALGDDYVEGDFFGSREREILALAAGEGHILMTDTSQSELSQNRVVDDQYDLTVDSDGESELETSVHYNDAGKSYETREVATSDTVDKSGTANLAVDKNEEVLHAVNGDHRSGNTVDINQEEVDHELFALSLKTEVQTASLSMSSAAKATLSGCSFKSSMDESSPSQQVSFYSANEDEVIQDENGSVLSNKRSEHSNSSPPIAAIHRQKPLAESAPYNGLGNAETSHSLRSTSSVTADKDSGEPPNPLSSPARVQISSPRQLYPCLHSPRGARSARLPRALISPSAAGSPTATDVPTIVPLKSPPAVASSPAINSPNKFACLPANAPLTTNKSLGKSFSDFDDGENRTFQQEPTHPSAEASIVSEERDTPQKVPTEFSIRLTKAELLADRQTSTTNPESLDMENKRQPQATYAIPSLPSYKNLHDIMAEPQDEEEDWVPLSKSTPAPRSRYTIQTLPHVVSASAQPAKGTHDVLDEEEEEGEEENEGDEYRKEHEKANGESSARQISPAKVTMPEPPSRGYHASTAASRSKLQASPLRKSPLKSPSRQNGLPVRRPASPIRGGGTILKSPARSFGTRPISPVHAQSPLRNVVSRPGSPSRSSSNDNTESGAHLSRPGPESPTRLGSALIRTGGVSQVPSASSLAAATATHAGSQSPMTSAFRNMKSSTADVFRKARLLLFDSSNENKNHLRAAAFPDAKVNASPVKKSNQESSNPETAATIAKSLYPDISEIVAEGGSPGRGITRPGGFETNSANSSITNTAKVLFPTHTLRSGTAANPGFPQQLTQLQLTHQPSQASLATSNTSQRSSINLSQISGTSTQKTSLDDVRDSGDLHLSPEAPTSKSVAVSAAAIALNSTAANSVSSAAISNKTAGTQVKRVKSAIRKPPSRAKHAPVVVRVPMGAQRELEQQRKIAAAAALSQLSPPEQPDSQLPVGTKPEEDKKAEQKREIERRRHENARRAIQQQQHQQDEKKTVDEDDQTRRKYNLSNRNSKVPHTRNGGNLGVIEDPKTLKRNFQVEAETSRLKASIAPTTVEQSKRRRTDELTGSPLESRVLTGVVRKDVAGKPVHQQTSTQSQNLMKAAVSSKGRTIPFVDAVKFSSDKIRFAADGGNTSKNNSNMNTLPVATSGQNLPATVPATQQYRLSQLSQMPVNSGDHIALPEIYSESEDDDDSSVILDWAHSPFLQEALRQQQLVDPDTVFGPVPPLLMEEVFRARTGGTARFRPRSSSANWSNNDRLTPQEIETYAAAMGYKNDNESGNGSVHT